MSSVDPPENLAFAPADPGFLVSIATFAFVALGLEAVVDGTILTLTGEIPDVYPLGWQVLAWLCLGAVWWAIHRGLVAWLRHRAADPEVPEQLSVDPADDHRRTTTALVLFVLAVLVGVILPVFLVGQWRLQPVQLYLDLYADYGGGAWLGLLGFAAYHVGRSLLLALVLTCVQRAVEQRWTARWTRALPVGGAVLGALLALPGLVLGGWAAAVSALTCCTLLGLVHNLTGRSLRWTAPAAVAVLLFL
ncbi:hypothetical protein ACH9EU_10340 [Kocuria sp. M1R5S2]|uniref:hypothetical protein n=1 Tax=Kocuria rhizosphaerae TaxID=3376285 RepID=UPI0037895545